MLRYIITAGSLIKENNRREGSSKLLRNPRKGSKTLETDILVNLQISCQTNDLDNKSKSDETFLAGD
jgi:hypothetical protein